MFKFLLILILIIYLLYKVGSFIFRTIFASASQFQQQQRGQYQQRTYQNQSKKAPGSNLNIDYVPKKAGHQDRRSIKGGDYVDFEEVKD